MNNKDKLRTRSAVAANITIGMAIAGIITAFALPPLLVAAAPDSLTRARFSKAIAFAERVRTAMMVCLDRNGGELSSCDAFTKLALPLYPSGATAVTVAITPASGVITAADSSHRYTYMLTPRRPPLPALFASAGHYGFTLSGSCPPQICHE